MQRKCKFNSVPFHIEELNQSFCGCWAVRVGKNGEARGFLGPLIWAVNEPVAKQERWCASGVLSAN